jgi:hypothetical protein
MPRVVKRSASEVVKSGPSRRSRPNSPLPLFLLTRTDIAWTDKYPNDVYLGIKFLLDLQSG